MQEISDKDIKLKISEFCTTSPQTRVSGSAKLRTRIREDNPGWQISERRFRRLRNEVQKEDMTLGSTQFPGNRRKISLGKMERNARTCLGLGLCSGRTVRKDESTGERVLQ
jgi:hypothetical protein